MKIYEVKLTENASFTAYIADPIKDYIRPAMLVIPGGGYGGLASDREGEPIALAFIAAGFNAFVLKYSVGRTAAYPTQLIEASLAIANIRDNADEYDIDTARVFAVGFSAGGHLCGMLGTMWHKQCVTDAGIEYGKNRPTGVMLIYPVVTGLHDFAHIGSFMNLLCTDTPSEEQLREVSLETNVTDKAVPMFVVHTSNDQVVDVRNALVLGEAYRKNGVLFEMHIYPDAPHGIALANEITRCGNAKWCDPQKAKWVDAAVAWSRGAASV